MKQKHRIAALLTAFCLLLTMLPIGNSPALATDGVLVGDGSAGSPYQIADAADLIAFRELVNSSANNRTLRAELTADIDLNPGYTFDEEGNPSYSGEGEAPGVQSWTPIATAGQAYTGAFDGKGHTIRGLYINTTSTYQGLFAAIGKNAAVQNLSIENSYVKGGNNTGSLMGRSQGGVVTNCSNAGTVSGGNYTGGLVGNNDVNISVISNCVNTGKVTGTGITGGIAGFGSSSSEITGCSNAGEVTGETAGGIVGRNNNSTSTVSNCRNTGSVNGSGTSSSTGGIAGYNSGGRIENCDNAGSVSASTNVGGIVGAHYSSGVIINCSNTGDVTASIIAGGLVGLKQNASITSSYNTGDVTATTRQAGGLVGRNYAGGSIQNCYSTGNIQAPSMAGGAVGQNDGDIQECYYLDTAASAGIGSGSGEAAAKTDDDMKGKDFVDLLNGSQDPAPWQADIATLQLNNGYPILSRQNPFSGGSGVEGDPFLISEKEELEAFRDLVNAGDTDIWGKLIADIDLNPGITFQADGAPVGGTPEQWTPIGSNSGTQYAGTFDGDGKTISGMYINGAGQSIGLFGYLGSGGAIQNLTVANSVVRGELNVGGIVGNSGGIIENCTNGGNVTATNAYAGGIAGICGLDDEAFINCRNTGNVQGYGPVGGIVGSGKGDITRCVNTGRVTGDVMFGAGGIIGIADNITISESYNTGSVNGAMYVGGIAGSFQQNPGDNKIDNCYNTGTVTGAVNGQCIGGLLGGGYGEITHSYNAGSIDGGAQYIGSVAGFLNGSASNAYYLAGSAENGVGYGSTAAVATPLSIDQMTGSGALGNMPGLDASVWTAGGDDTAWEYLGENAEGQGVYGLMASLPQLNVFTANGHEEIPLETAAGLQQATDPDDGRTYYLIHDAEELGIFRDIVNGSLESGSVYTADPSANGRLMDNIDLNPGITFRDDGSYTDGTTPLQWTPMGSAAQAYTGAFDGNGKIISGLYINRSDADDQGLFGDIAEDASIQNLGIVNSYVSAKEYVGSLVGCVWGGVVQGCYNTGAVAGSANIGGLAGDLEYGAIQDCYNTGPVSASNQAGGIAGMNYDRIENCFNTGAVSGDASIGGIAGYNGSEWGARITNSYYLDTCVATRNGGIYRTVDEMTGPNAPSNMYGLDFGSTWTAGGENAWESMDENEDGTIVYGMMAKLPQLTVFVEANGHEGIPLQTVTGLQQETDPDDGKTYYLIYNDEQLKTFRNIVNGTDLTEGEQALYGQNGNNAANGRLMADIVLNEDFDQTLFGVDDDGNVTYNGSAAIPAFAQWEPIGTDSCRYTGSFDGNDKTVSGIYINNNDVFAEHQGLFGRVNGGSIQNLGVVNSYISAYKDVGGIVGLLVNGSVTNCYNAGMVTGVNDYVGGIGGQISGSTVQNCYNTGAVTGYSYIGGVAGAIQGSYEQDCLMDNCYNTGDVTGVSGAGGVAGDVAGVYTNGTIQNCYNTGDVTVDGVCVGGVTAYVHENGTLQNCYNTGMVTCGTGAIGGVAGSAVAMSTVKNCYFLEGTAPDGIYTNECAGEATALSIEGMTGSDAVTTMSLDTTVWTAGDEETAWEYLRDNADNTGSYGQMAKLPQLTVFVANGHEGIPLETVDGLQQEAVDGEMYYRIYDAGQLKTFRSIVNNTNLSDDEKNIYGASGDAAANGKLMADIVLNEDFDQTLFGVDDDGNITYDGSAEIPGFAQWTPIGNSSRRYTGAFDGNEHTVSGMYINNDEADVQGLFGQVGESSVIQNLGIVNSYVRANDYVGGIVGHAQGSPDHLARIANCFNQATVIGTSSYAEVGGITSHAYCTDVEDSYNAGLINGRNFYTGGVAGYIRESTVTNCYNTGTVISSNSNYTGGVVGYVNGGNITNCYYLDTSVSAGIGSGNSQATSLTVAQIESTSAEDGLLARLASGSGESVWSTQLSAVGTWEYGKPAVQPVFTWQTVVPNAPAYTVTIPEKATAEGDAVSVSMTGGALLAVQQVEVSLAEDTAFNLYYGGNTSDDAIAYQVFAGDSQTALTAGQTILTGNNTEAGKPNQVDLTFDVTGTPKYSGDYTGTLTFTVSVDTKDAA